MDFNKNHSGVDVRFERPGRQGKRSSSDPPSDARKPRSRREALGQVPTPPEVARYMAALLFHEAKPEPSARILEPCVGDGPLLTAVLNNKLVNLRHRITAIDIDPAAIRKTETLARDRGRQITFVRSNYLTWTPTEPFDYVILNPPYVRQEWISGKQRYIARFSSKYGIALPGTSNLYAYFLLKVLSDLKPGGRFVALVYDSMQATRFGRSLMKIMHSMCDRIEYYAVGEQPFHGRLIDAVIVAGTKSHALISRTTTTVARELEYGRPFVRLGDLFVATRGLRLKQTNIFLTKREDVSRLGATRFVKKVRHALPFAISKEHPEAALLAQSPEGNELIRRELTARLKRALEEPDFNRPIIAWHKHRPRVWWLHRAPPRAAILFNYYVRGEPRHLFNPIGAFSDNFYGITARWKFPTLAVLAVMNSSFVRNGIRAVWRNQGNGLKKVQLFEYRSIPMLDLGRISERSAFLLTSLGKRLIGVRSKQSVEITRRIDSILCREFALNNCEVPDPIIR